MSAVRKVDDLPRLGYSAREVSQMINVPYSTLMAQIATGEIPARKVGRQYVIPADFVESYGKDPRKT